MSSFQSVVSGAITHPTPQTLQNRTYPPARDNPPAAPLPLYTILSMVHSKVRDKVWREKYVGVLEGSARCPRFQTTMPQDER